MDSKYKYTYERTADYCYKDTDVLINKLNITNDEELYEEERLNLINTYCIEDLKKFIIC